MEIIRLCAGSGTINKSYNIYKASKKDLNPKKQRKSIHIIANKLQKYYFIPEKISRIYALNELKRLYGEKADNKNMEKNILLYIKAGFIKRKIYRKDKIITELRRINPSVDNAKIEHLSNMVLNI